MKLAAELRRRGISVDLDHRARGLRKQLGQANDLRARFLVVLGDDEVRAERGRLKDMDSGGERETALDAASLAAALAPVSCGGCGGCSDG